MARLRYNNVVGTLGAALTSSGTTITFASAPSFATISGSDYIPLVLEPPSGSSPSASFEIVHLTAYTAGTSTGTIARGQEGTTGVAHSSGVLWQVGPTLADISTRPFIDPTWPQFGADPSGSSDSYPAISSAIAALPAGGGTIYLPKGSYKLNTQLTISSDGVRIVSDCSPFSTNSVRLFAGATMNSLLVVENSGAAINGCGLKNLILDGSSNVSFDALKVVSSQWGRYDNLVVKGAPGQDTIAATSQTTAGTNGMHNSWRQIYVEPGTTNQSGGLLISGNFTNATTNACYDVWEDLTVAWQSAASGILLYGIWLQACDNIRIRNVHMYQVTPVGENRGLQLDYSGASAAWPADCNIENIDFGSASTTIKNLGTPTGATANRVLGVSGSNGQPANPSLPNLDWGYSLASP